MRTEIHIARESKQFGPYTLEEVNRNLQQGLLQPTDLAWHEGMTNWAALSTIEGVTTTGGQRTAPTQPARMLPTRPDAALRDTRCNSTRLSLNQFFCLP